MSSLGRDVDREDDGEAVDSRCREDERAEVSDDCMLAVDFPSPVGVALLSST